MRYLFDNLNMGVACSMDKFLMIAVWMGVFGGGGAISFAGTHGETSRDLPDCCERCSITTDCKPNVGDDVPVPLSSQDRPASAPPVRSDSAEQKP